MDFKRIVKLGVVCIGIGFVCIAAAFIVSGGDLQAISGGHQDAWYRVIRFDSDDFSDTKHEDEWEKVEHKLDNMFED